MSRKESLEHFTQIGVQRILSAKEFLTEKKKDNDRRIQREFNKIYFDTRDTLSFMEISKRLTCLALESAIPGSVKTLDNSDMEIAKDLHTALEVIWNNIWQVQEYDIIKRRFHHRSYRVPHSERPSNLPSKLGENLNVFEPQVTLKDVTDNGNYKARIIEKVISRGAKINLNIRDNDTYYQTSIYIGSHQNNLRFGLGHIVQKTNRRIDVVKTRKTEPNWFSSPRELINFLGRLEWYVD